MFTAEEFRAFHAGRADAFEEALKVLQHNTSKADAIIALEVRALHAKTDEARRKPTVTSPLRMVGS